MRGFTNIQGIATPRLWVTRSVRDPEIRLAAAVSSALESGNYLPVLVPVGPFDAGSVEAVALLAGGDYAPVIVPFSLSGGDAWSAGVLSGGVYFLAIVPAPPVALGGVGVSAALSSGDYVNVVFPIPQRTESAAVAASLASGTYA